MLLLFMCAFTPQIFVTPHVFMVHVLGTIPVYVLKDTVAFPVTTQVRTFIVLDSHELLQYATCKVVACVQCRS